MPFDGISIDACRARIRERNELLNAVLSPVAPRDACGDGPLAGVPYVLKDTWDTAGILTTGGSYRHRARVPEVSSHAHRALEAAGAVLLGKSNLCDLAFSAESDNHLRGPVRNPRDPARTAGGSTGGGAAAVADGMAAFDWGTDFGGSIRGPAAFCGIVGMRLSHRAWPVGHEHFPRIAPFFWDMCGMGPLTKNVEDARVVTRAVKGALKTGGTGDVPMDLDRVVLWAPDRAHTLEWPTFLDDIRRVLDRAGIAHAAAAELPTPSRVNDLFTEYLAAHFDEFMASGELSLGEGFPAVLLGLASRGRLDKRVHPNTGTLLLAVAAMSLRHRDKKSAATGVAKLREATARIWDRKTLILSPTTTERPPKHGRAAFRTRLMSFCKMGNLVDATGLALPFGAFAARRRRFSRGGDDPAMPRSLQIMGPPGSEEAVYDLGARLEPLLG